MTKPYRTIFAGELVQDSALSVGGNEGRGGTVDDPLCLDGKERFTLRGTTLAGALIATARKVWGGDLPPAITTRIDKAKQSQEDQPDRSCWRVYTSHPLDMLPERSEERQGVGIHQSTGAAAQGVLFDAETLPRGTRWPFYLEVDTFGTDAKVEQIAAAAL